MDLLCLLLADLHRGQQSAEDGTPRYFRILTRRRGLNFGAGSAAQPVASPAASGAGAPAAGSGGPLLLTASGADSVAAGPVGPPVPTPPQRLAASGACTMTAGRRDVLRGVPPTQPAPAGATGAGPACAAGRLLAEEIWRPPPAQPAAWAGIALSTAAGAGVLAADSGDRLLIMTPTPAWATEAGPA